MEAAYFAKCCLTFNGTKEEKDCCAVLFNDSDVFMGDARLNNIAALTYNMGTCTRIFEVLKKAIIIADNPWKTLLKAVNMLHTIVLYGSELSIDFAVKLCPIVYSLTDYNSALVKRSVFSFGGGGVGTDYGGPVREQAIKLYDILSCDANIRMARAQARDGGGSWAIPKGEVQQHVQNQNNGIVFGQGNANQTSGMGAGFGLENVPGMYDGRPERYFDKDDDDRRHGVVTGDHQITREKLAPDLLDLAFGDTSITTPAATFGQDHFSSVANRNYPGNSHADSGSSSGGYLNQATSGPQAAPQAVPPIPVPQVPQVDAQMEKQRQLEALLAEQQAQLQKLMAMQNANASGSVGVHHMGEQGDNMGMQGGNIGVLGGNMGVPGGNMGMQGANMGMQGGNMGMQGANMGMQGGNMGMQGGNMGMQGVNMGMQAANMGVQGGNMGMQGGNMGMQGANMGMQQMTGQQFNMDTPSQVPNQQPGYGNY